MTSGTSRTSPGTETAIKRAIGYELLARAVAYPDEANVEALRESAELARALFEGSPLEPLVGAVAVAPSTALAESYVRLFSLSSSPDCPTFETALLSNDHLQMTERMADVAGFYRAFGVEAKNAGFRPDELSVELEFMGFLCRKEAYAAEHLGAPRVAQVVRAQKLFLRDHLARWAPAVGRRMTLRSAAGSLYAAVGIALETWLEEDVAFIGAGPVAAVDIPDLTWTRPEDEPEGPEFGPDVISPDDIPLA